MMLGHEVVITVEYSYSASGGCQVHDLFLMKWIDDRNEQFVDKKADGSYDILHISDPNTQADRDYVFYEGQWREVEEYVGYYRSRLVDGEEVMFDMESGKWLPVTKD